ncbi:hypothetical protein PFISCL1PPCAC_17792, partial [Pristionchus fissidentatus]
LISPLLLHGLHAAGSAHPCCLHLHAVGVQPEGLSFPYHVGDVKAEFSAADKLVVAHAHQRHHVHPLKLVQRRVDRVPSAKVEYEFDLHQAVRSTVVQIHRHKFGTLPLATILARDKVVDADSDGRLGPQRIWHHEEAAADFSRDAEIVVGRVVVQSQFGFRFLGADRRQGNFLVRSLRPLFLHKLVHDAAHLAHHRRLRGQGKVNLHHSGQRPNILRVVHDGVIARVRSLRSLPVGKMGNCSLLCSQLQAVCSSCCSCSRRSASVAARWLRRVARQRSRQPMRLAVHPLLQLLPLRQLPLLLRIARHHARARLYLRHDDRLVGRGHGCCSGGCRALYARRRHWRSLLLQLLLLLHDCCRRRSHGHNRASAAAASRLLLQLLMSEEPVEAFPPLLLHGRTDVCCSRLRLQREPRLLLQLLQLLRRTTLLQPLHVHFVLLIRRQRAAPLRRSEHQRLQAIHFAAQPHTIVCYQLDSLLDLDEFPVLRVGQLLEPVDLLDHAFGARRLQRRPTQLLSRDERPNVALVICSRGRGSPRRCGEVPRQFTRSRRIHELVRLCLALLRFGSFRVAHLFHDGVAVVGCGRRSRLDRILQQCVLYYYCHRPPGRRGRALLAQQLRFVH